MDVNKLAKQNGLLVRGDAYYFQARIPLDCRKDFSGKTIYRERLEARTLAEAKAHPVSGSLASTASGPHSYTALIHSGLGMRTSSRATSGILEWSFGGIRGS